MTPMRAWVTLGFVCDLPDDDSAADSAFDAICDAIMDAANGAGNGIYPGSVSVEDANTVGES